MGTGLKQQHVQREEESSEGFKKQNNVSDPNTMSSSMIEDPQPGPSSQTGTKNSSTDIDKDRKILSRSASLGTFNTAGKGSSIGGTSSRMKRHKSRPHLRRLSSMTGAGAGSGGGTISTSGNINNINNNLSSCKLIYSVDDDINEEELDEAEDVLKDNVQYLEGYNDALKSLLQSRRSGDAEPAGPHHPLNSGTEGAVLINLKDAEEKLKRLENLERNPPRMVSELIHEVEGVESPRMDPSPIGGSGGGVGSSASFGSSTPVAVKSPGIGPVDTLEENQGGEDLDDNNSVHSTSLSATLELLNLRERQDAINSTHPFGIKIWKPSLYKKKRSVAARAEEDIHDFDPHKPTKSIYWGVYLTNFIWCVTFGLFLNIVCIISALFVFVFTGFALQPKSRAYVLVLLRLGVFLNRPFGKFVLLNKDKRYIDEDQFEGRSITEFHMWRMQEEGRLFYAPPRRPTSSGETRPLLKDHLGRSIDNLYSSADIPPTTVDDDDDDNQEFDIKVRFFGRGKWSIGRLVFYIWFYGILQPIIILVSLLCYLFVFTIPMAKLTSTICYHLRRHPLALEYEMEKNYYTKLEESKRNNKKLHQLLIACTYRCCGFHYYKYTIDGTNIFFINLLSIVILVILDHYLLKEHFGLQLKITDPMFIFSGCLFSIIPLAYFIGQAVASISAQSSMGVGAVINAFFSTVVEIFLYCVALDQSKGKLVEGSMIGSILGAVLLLPGLSMCGGAFKRKTQRYNPRSAGVSSTMLLFAMVIMFAPSIFYEIYGLYEIRCSGCTLETNADKCARCRFYQPTFSYDELYERVLKPFSIAVVIGLFIAYVCGLFFTLRTHASLIWATLHEPVTKKDSINDPIRSPSITSMDTTPLQLATAPAATATGTTTLGRPSMRSLELPPSANFKSGIFKDTKENTPMTASYTSSLANSPMLQGIKSRNRVKIAPAEPLPQKKEENDELALGHDAPNWSRNKSVIILLGATLLYAIIAEILVDNVDSVLSVFPINPKFLGLTVFALVPNTTEFLNAILFAIGGNVALSLEIGSAYALQVVLIQIPALVLYTIYSGTHQVEQMFALVFPRWDIIATLISIYLFIYVYAEGKSNYFKGVILILSYCVVLFGFLLNDKVEELNDGYTIYTDPRALGWNRKIS